MSQVSLFIVSAPSRIPARKLQLFPDMFILSKGDGEIMMSQRYSNFTSPPAIYSMPFEKVLNFLNPQGLFIDFFVE
jgi:hypothetical protein